MVTVSHIHRMSSLHYFNKGDALAFREEVVPEPANDEEVVFKEFFTAGLRMPSRPTLADILHKFWLQLHQLTPNAIAQLSKYFWTMLSFDGIPTSDGFTKRYELHYQSKKVDADEVVMFL
jgi:hypothetical protein